MAPRWFDRTAATAREAGGHTRRVTTPVAEFLRQETTGGRLLLGAIAAALLWANLAAGSYEQVWARQVAFGPSWVHLSLPLYGWVGDGLLSVFFFVAGLEVKRELTVGELAGWRAAALPVGAAVGGMIVPALVAIGVSRGAALDGGAWAIPVATDIAFALGVLALVGSALPSGVRLLLLSMAVIDDLGAIGLIALLFSHDLRWEWLISGAALCAAYGYAQRRHWNAWWLVVPLALAAWVCVHASGVHATVTGVVLGLLTPVRAAAGETQSPAERLEYRLHPWSAGVVVPVFAISAAGIPLSAAGAAVLDPLAHGIVAGLVLGKTAGILIGVWLVLRLRLGTLPDGLGWNDVLPVAVLGGVGYTVSLLIARLSLADAAADRAAAAVLVGSAIASAVAVVLLRKRSRVHSLR